MYLKAEDTVLRWANDLIMEEVHGKSYDEEPRALTVDEVAQIAQVLALWVSQQRKKEEPKITGEIKSVPPLPVGVGRRG